MSEIEEAIEFRQTCGLCLLVLACFLGVVL